MTDEHVVVFSLRTTYRHQTIIYRNTVNRHDI